MSDSATLMRFAMEAVDDGAAQSRSGVVYSFRLNEAVPADHPIRQIAGSSDARSDLSCIRSRASVNVLPSRCDDLAAEQAELLAVNGSVDV